MMVFPLASLALVSASYPCPSAGIASYAFAFLEVNSSTFFDETVDFRAFDQAMA